MNISWLFLTYNYFGFLHANAFEPEINLNNTKKTQFLPHGQQTPSPSQMPIG